MMKTSHEQPSNAEFWQRYDAIESRLTASVSERMLELAGLESGMTVLDLATGRGEPALRAARRVGPQGRVIGIDCSSEMLGMAQQRAAREGITNLELHAISVESLAELETPHFHAVTARWGLMYLADPLVALRHVHRVLLPDGVMVSALWAEPLRVPFLTLPRTLLARYRQLPAIDFEAPGSFRYSRLDQITRDFQQAGFLIDHIEEKEVAVIESESADELLDWVCSLGVGPLLTELSASEVRAWEQALRSELETQREAGVLRLGGVTRIIRVRPN